MGFLSKYNLPLSKTPPKIPRVAVFEVNMIYLGLKMHFDKNCECKLLITLFILRTQMRDFICFSALGGGKYFLDN